MNIDIKNGLIFMVLAGVFTTTGYFGRDYIESNNKQKEFTFSIYKKFYDTSSAKIEKINKSYGNIIDLLSSHYALTPIELSMKYESFI